VYSKQTPLVPTDLPALFPRELCRQLEIHLHSWFAKHHKNKPTQKKPSDWMTGRIKGCSVCCAYWPACLSPKRTPSTVRNSPHTWFTKCHKNKPTQKIYVCVLCLHYHYCCHKNKPTQKIYVSLLCLCYHCCCHKNKPTQKEDGPSGWRDEFRVAVNRRMTRWMNWPSDWMDDCTDLREPSLSGFKICRHSSFTICNNNNNNNNNYHYPI